MSRQYTYRHHDGRRGTGPTAYAAVLAALGPGAWREMGLSAALDSTRPPRRCRARCDDCPRIPSFQCADCPVRP